MFVVVVSLAFLCLARAQVSYAGIPDGNPKVNNRNLQNFAAQSPEQIQQALQLLQNPFVAQALVNANGRQENFNENFYNLYQNNPNLASTTTTRPQLPASYEDLLDNPYFASFFQNAEKVSGPLPTPQASLSPTIRRTKTHGQNHARTQNYDILSRVEPGIQAPISSQLEEEDFQPEIRLPTPLLISAQTTRTAPKSAQQTKLEEELFRQQAEGAKYSFASEIDDTINQNQHQRQEIRDGVNVKGSYSYSDGFVKRTVHYEADENGYRVVKENVEELGNGPEYNPEGHADVSSFVAGMPIKYSITKADIPERKKSQFVARPQL